MIPASPELDVVIPIVFEHYYSRLDRGPTHLKRITGDLLLDVTIIMRMLSLGIVV
jgi:hypothetical protein